MKKGNELVKVMYTRFTQTMLNVSHELNVKDVVDIYLVSLSKILLKKESMQAKKGQVTLYQR